MSKSYQDYVDQCKKILSEIESKKYEVAKLALEICEIQAGGRQNHYNLKDFAKDIGLEYSSLKEWVKIYRDVCLMMNIDKPTKDQWTKARKTRIKIAKGDRAATFTPEKVKKAYAEVDLGTSVFSSSKNYGKETFEFIYKDVKRIFIATQKLDLNTQDQASIKNTLEILNRLSLILTGHVTKKTKLRAG